MPKIVATNGDFTLKLLLASIYCPAIHTNIHNGSAYNFIYFEKMYTKVPT